MAELCPVACMLPASRSDGVRHPFWRA